ncbi:DUF1566 domain-containing protein [Leptothrix ochracea]|uniref:Lcl C-terminal domain-containing protein n=1 Tax=Leptothrix ochracea TaxID=735331 RepID=UPI0034E1E09F
MTPTLRVGLAALSSCLALLVACGGGSSTSVPPPPNTGGGGTGGTGTGGGTTFPATVSKLTDTGVPASRCFAAGNTTSFVSCTSPEALALNAQQDGMVGRDVAYPDSSDGFLGFNYTKLDANGAALPAFATTWSCVKDNITGLTWEVKTTDGGLRDWTKTYTNYGDNRLGDASTFVTAVNAVGLCGALDWRLPTAEELQSIVDYAGVNPAIDTTFFPNTPASNYFWSSSPVVGGPSYAWLVDFNGGYVGNVIRGGTVAVRLVR